MQEPMSPARRRAYLQAMGITEWQSRHPVPPVDGLETAVVLDAPGVDVAGPQVAADAAAGSTGSSRDEPAARASSQAPGETGASTAEPEMPAWLMEEPPLEDLEPVLPEKEHEEPRSPGNRFAHLDWDGLRATVSRCEACGLHQGRQQTVFGVGNRQADLLVLGEAPGAEEDRQGEPFVGRAGQLLNAMLGAIGLSREQVFIANILKCRPPQNRDPRPEEVVSCSAYLQRQIELLQPKLILCVGRVAAQNLLKSEEPVGKLRGREWRHQDIPVRVSYHPAYLLRSPAEKAKAWQDLQWVAARLRG